MKKIILMLLLILPCVLMSQDPQYRKIKIGLSYSPQYNSRSLNFGQSNQWLEAIRNNKEVGKYGFTAGITLQYTINKKWAIESGLLYSDQGYKTKWEDLTWEEDDVALPKRAKTIYHYQYAVIPLKVNYYLRDARLKYFVSAGIIPHFLLSRRTVLKTDGDDKQTNSQRLGYAETNVQIMLGGGINYRLSKRFDFTVAPFYQRSLTSVSVYENEKEFLYSAGLQTAVAFSFYKRR